MSVGGEKRYHTVLATASEQVGAGSSGSVVAARVSTESENGTPGTVVAPAKSSLAGGTPASRPKTRSPAPRREPGFAPTWTR